MTRPSCDRPDLNDYADSEDSTLFIARSSSEQECSVSPAHLAVAFDMEVDMDHNESIRKFEQLMMRESGHAHEAAIELEALVAMLPGEKSRELAHLQIRASNHQAKEFREMAQKIKES